ncbi:MAG: VOC family protein [Anaerolineales bacterium]|nr:VOC family protein [Anaerolineales bacterium]
MAGNNLVTQICVVVRDVRRANAHWSRVLGVPEEKIETIFPPGVLLHYTHGAAAEYTDCQVAKYQLAGFVLELIQPGASPSPWRTFLEEHGQGVFHFCVLVDDRKAFQHTLAEIGVDLPYHVGYHPSGSYSYVDTREALGLELSVNNQADNRALFQGLMAGAVNPMDELK